MRTDARTQTFGKSLSDGNHAATVLFMVLLFAAMSLVWSGKASAVPAPNDKFEVKQPDGNAFVARKYGDEWNNGVETVSGYTVVKDAGVWEFAERAANGGLKPSDQVVAEDAPPQVPKHLRSELPSDLPPSDPDSAFAPNGAAPGELESPALSSPNTGTQKTLVILAQFSDQRSQGTTVAQWRARYFGASNSVKDYYNEVSYGKLNLAPAAEGHGTAKDGVVGWVTLNQRHPNVGGNTGDANRLTTRNAILAANRYVNYGAYDTNRDGFIAPKELHVTVIVAGEEASACYPQVCASKSVWGHQWNLLDAGSQAVGVKAPVVDGVQVAQETEGGGYTQFGEKHLKSMATLGIMVHEMGHDLNLPDLYDTDVTDGTSEGVGEWSIMGSGSWLELPNAANGSMPSHPDPFSKSYQGWLAPTKVAGTNVAKSIAHSAKYAAAFQLRDNPNGVDWTFGSKSGTGEYFLVENRQKVGYDAALPACGMLVWHIDESLTFNNGYEGVSGANSDEAHRLVDLEEADGLNQLDAVGQSRGDEGDPFKAETGRTAFNGATNPNSKLYDNTGSGVAMSNASACGTTMSANFTADAVAPPPNPGPTGTIKINAGAQATRNISNKLTLSASDADGVAQMRFHNDSGAWTAWETYATTKTWNIRAVQGERTVFVQYKDRKGNISGETAIKDTIEYDTVSPKVTDISPVPGSRDVPLNTSVEITFDDDMNAASLEKNVIIRRLHTNNTYTSVSAAVTYYSTSKTVVLNPVNNLVDNATYVISVIGEPTGGGVKDSAYNEIDQYPDNEFPDKPGTQGHFWRLYTLP